MSGTVLGAEDRPGEETDTKSCLLEFIFLWGKKDNKISKYIVY